MTYASQAAQYREMQVMTASPGQLLVQLFDHLLVNLRRAQMAMDVQDTGVRSQKLDRARLIIGELLASLNYEKGGEIARNLAALYTFSLGELVAPTRRQLEVVTRVITDLREGYAGIVGVASEADEG